MNVQDQPKGSRERTLDEVKTEFMKRAGKLNPFEDIKREDAERVMAALKNLDKDHWAEEWSKLGHEYEAKGDAAAKAGKPGKELAEIYMHAFDACRVGRYPSPVSPGKLKAYEHSLRMFRKAAKHFDPKLEIVEIPFQGHKLVGYLQKPSGVAKPPVVMHWGGVDGWKEDRLRIADHIMKAGLASLTIDGPGTGETPMLYGDPSAEPMFHTWLDYLPTRNDIDGQRVAVWGGSFGAYWAARLAFTAAGRIKGAVFHGGNVHYGFQPEWLIPAFTTGGATYLFGAASLLDARGRAMGVKTIDEFLAAVAPLSLKTMGLLDKPSAPLLGVNGKLDDQAPIADVYLLMEHGNPKSARVYADGHHMGRTPGQPAEHITHTIVDWLKERLAPSA
jgi:pimeloyl-ACP methyl ester carboxylesterase